MITGIKMSYSEKAYLIKNITVPSCGHVDCAEFMGCIFEFRKKLGVTDFDLRKAKPGVELKVAVMGESGFSEKDWVIVGGDWWIDYGNYV